MKKIESDYLDLYGDTSKNDVVRFFDYIDKVNLTDSDREIVQDRVKRNQNIKWNKVRFIIYLIPKATPRPRINRFSNTFYVVGARDNRDIFGKYMKTFNIPIVVTPCKFKCISYLPIPNSMSSIEKILAELGLIYPIGKPDWDNLGKTYSDMIQDSFIMDDYLIIEGTSKKYYSAKPRIEITIEYMEEFDSIYNENKINKKLQKGRK